MDNNFYTIDVTVPIDQCVVYKDYYWFCKNGDPKQALMYFKSPQCNKNKKVQDVLGEKYDVFKQVIAEGFTVTFIALAYVPRDKLFY